jgi:transposase
MQAATQSAQTVDQGQTLRMERGKLLVSHKAVDQRRPGIFIVKSQSHGGHYVVEKDTDTGETTCTCLDWEHRRLACKHILATQISVTVSAMSDGSVAVQIDATTTRVKRPTYKQNWPLYDAAQSHEKEYVAKLLRGLCDMVKEEPQANGRPRLPVSDRIFAVTEKVFGGLSTRRSATDMRSWGDAGMMSKTPSWSSVADYLADPGLTPHLYRLIEASALPLASVESQFSVDGTGFTTAVYRRWFDHRYGRECKEATWVKLHACIGTRTNVIASCKVTEGTLHDSPELTGLVESAATRFDMAEVSADKGYLSFENVEAIEKAGATPFISFKQNSRGDAKYTTEAWKRMWHWFQFNREDYLAHYHRRSNVETTFHMVKSKFGGNVRCRTFPAQTNEVLAKCLAHNCSVLVHEMFELGIVPQFWPDAPVGKVIGLSEKGGNP